MINNGQTTNKPYIIIIYMPVKALLHLIKTKTKKTKTEKKSENKHKQKSQVQRKSSDDNTFGF